MMTAETGKIGTFAEWLDGVRKEVPGAEMSREAEAAMECVWGRVQASPLTEHEAWLVEREDAHKARRKAWDATEAELADHDEPSPECRRTEDLAVELMAWIVFEIQRGGQS